MVAERDDSPSLTINRNREAPYGWIQWKGTDVCMDIHCACGELLHVDADFLYHVRCGHCGQVYECSGFIDLHPLDFEPGNTLVLYDKDDGYPSGVRHTPPPSQPEPIQRPSGVWVP